MNPLQRASRNRKIAYFGAIAVLFTISMVWRGMIPVPLGTSPASAAQPFRWAEAHTVQNQAQRLEVWESDPTEGEADISGSAARLALTGSRGVAVTVLWLSAIEKQKRNDFHEFEQRVGMVTKLQPNFITPWIFQSWNIAYNVSVEMHGSGDMYYYIVRGIQLLAEGERRNKRSPDMRYQIAFYYQNKFGVADQADVLRCLYDLSCIPPNQRDPDALMKPTRDDPNVKELDVAAFRKFCTDHPHLVRRLRGDDTPNPDKKAKEKLRLAKVEDVIAFLRTNREVPTRYRGKGDDLKEPTDATTFPVLPPKFDTGSDEFAEAHPGSETATDFAPGTGYFSAFKSARAWYSYSLLLLPPPMKDDAGNTVPSPTTRPGEFGHDPSKHRVPRLPMMILFRQGAPRAQSFHAEMEQKEGWFDGEGWRIDEGTNPALWWFPALHLPEEAVPAVPTAVLAGLIRVKRLLHLSAETLPALSQAGVPDAVAQKLYRSPLKGATLPREAWDGELARVLGAEDAKLYRDAVLGATVPRPLDVVVGTNRDWSLTEWERAAGMWGKHGKAYGLTLNEVQHTEMNTLGNANMPQDPTPEQLADPNFRKRFFAVTAKASYDSNRNVTNFPYFLASAEAEANKTGSSRTVDARKMLWKAEQARKNGKKDVALALYKSGLELWKQVMTNNPKYHRLAPPDRGERGEEETCEYELAYQRLLVTTFDPRVTQRANEVAHAAHAIVPFLTDPFLKGDVTPQWSSNNREEIKWFIVETTSARDFESVRDEAARKLLVPNETPAARDERVRKADEAQRKKEDFSSPFVDPTNPERWVREDIKEMVRVRQGISRRQQGPPTVPANTPPSATPPG